MLDNIQINLYRNIKKASIEDLKMINVFIGPNNCGKTSYLEAGYLLTSPLSFQAFITVLSNRSHNFRLSQRSFLSDAAWLFNKRNLDNKIAISGMINKTKYSITAQLKEYNEVVQGKINLGNNQNIEIGRLLLSFNDSSKNNTRNSEYPLTNSQGWVLPQINNPPLQNAALINPHWHSDQMVGVREYSYALKNNFTKDSIDLIQEFDPTINDVKIILDENGLAELFIDSSSLGLHPISLLGDGYRRIFLSSIIMAQVKNGCIFIDEFDEGIHYRALKKYINWLVSTAQKYNIQLFLSTHSIDVINILASCDDDVLKMTNLYKLRNDEDPQIIPGYAIKNAINELGVDIR
jgi:AAA15 family ATPase/GTPase